MSIQAMNAVISRSESSGNDFVVLLMIANYCGPDGSGAFPSVSTLARDARVGEKTVRRAVSRLVELGELEAVPGGGRTSTRYRVLIVEGGHIDHAARSGYDHAGGSDSDHLSVIEPSSKKETKTIVRWQDDEEFMEVKAAYPRRAGAQPWQRAWMQYRARIKNGARHEDILAGTIAYAKFCRATKKTDTEYVMQAQRFFGINAEWHHDWRLPKDEAHRGTSILDQQ